MPYSPLHPLIPKTCLPVTVSWMNEWKELFLEQLLNLEFCLMFLFFLTDLQEYCNGKWDNFSKVCKIFGEMFH